MDIHLQHGPRTGDRGCIPEVGSVKQTRWTVLRVGVPALRKGRSGEQTVPEKKKQSRARTKLLSWGSRVESAVQESPDGFFILCVVHEMQMRYALDVIEKDV